jgi:tight adherence protein C
MFLLLIGLATTGAVGALLFYAMTSAETRIAGRSSLKAIEEYTWKNHEPVAEEPPFIDRVVKPIYENTIGIGKRFTPVGYVENVREKLIHAGRRGPDELDRFLAIRVATVAAIPVVGLLLAFVPTSGRNAVAMFLLMVVILGIGPDAKLNQQVSTRKKQIRRSLPDVLDLLTISVEAGLGFEQAIDRISDAVPGPLTDEFNRMIGEMRAGSARSEALQAMDDRIGVEEVKSFVLSMIQADQFGVSIGRVLRAQADEMRIKRRQIAQEAAQKAPVKMLLPMTFLIFPALFVVILGPAMFNIATSL